MNLLGTVVSVSLGIVATAGAQPVSDASKLSRQQRAALQAIVAAVDSGAPAMPVADAEWPLHVLRASDGSHYVAFSIIDAPDLQPERPAVFYVRLATRSDSLMAGTTERSTLAEWLAGRTAAPPPAGRRGIAFGDMPTYGAGSIAQRGPGAQTQTLQLLDLERQRAREKRDTEERERKAALEGEATSRGPRPLLPFEDFDVRSLESPDGASAVLRRSFTAGPGDYELTVAWADPAARNVPSTVRVVRRAVSLPTASMTELALSSVIVADDVLVRETPLAATDQTAFPYSIGSMDIRPAADHVLTNDERLALVVQVINARGSSSGKPDVVVGFRLFRKTGAAEEPVGTLASQIYNEITLPVDFDVAKRHPIFAAVGVPLRTFKRGEYRLEISATDRLAGTGVTRDTTFTVTATAAALLAEAPPLAPRFDPASLAAPLQQALQQPESPAAVQIMRGGQRAGQGNDVEAIEIWQAAIDAGADRAVVTPLLVDALLRRGEAARAIAAVRQAGEAGAHDPQLTRQLAAAHMALERREEALEILERHLEGAPDDADAQWLAIHALFAGFAKSDGPGSDESGRARLMDLLAKYITAEGTHTALAREWRQQVR